MDEIKLGKGKGEDNSVSPEGTGAASPEILPVNTEMEVQHHHHKDHRSKHLKEYLKEGLMIFIAVMLGFIAENIREGITNREHVRELISQLARDLKNDTIQLNTVYNGEKDVLDADDTLLTLLQLPLKEMDIGKLQELIHRAHSLWPFHPSGGAMAAIKNELHLKQFSGSRMIGLIAEYEKHFELLHTDQEITLQYQRTYIDPFMLQHFTAASLATAFNKSPGSKPETRNLTQELCTQLASDMVLISINTEELILTHRKLKSDALNLLQYIREEYTFNE